MTTAPTFDVTLTRVFASPIGKVWQAWTEDEMVKKWWGPTGFSCPVAKMNVREGGKSLVCMKAPAEYGGAEIFSTWTYTKVVPNESFDYIFNFSDKDGNKITPSEAGVPGGIPEDGHHSVSFKKIDDSATEVTILERGYFDEQTQQMSLAGLTQCFDKMAEALKG